MYPCPYIYSDKRPLFLRGYDAVLMYRRFLILFFLAWQRGGKWVSNIRRNSCDNFFILVRAWAGHLRSSLGETESSIFIWKKIWGMERECVCVWNLYRTRSSCWREFGVYAELECSRDECKFSIFWHVWGRTEESFVNPGREREHQRDAGTTDTEIWTASNFLETLTRLRY